MSLDIRRPKYDWCIETGAEPPLRVRTVILTGLTGDICVLFTANDAYMRGVRLVVPADCVASQDPDENRHALRHMRRVLKADVRPSTALNLNTLQAKRSDNP